jgi:hypothetical protein
LCIAALTRKLSFNDERGAAMELDHIFIFTPRGAPQADRLCEFGLSEGSPNRHPGQGTANRRFFFHNAMLELLWLDDLEEAQSEGCAATRLWQRGTRSDPSISPFGVCFRPSGEEPRVAPFPSWSYRPAYLPASLAVEIATDAPLSEPMWFYLNFAARPDKAAPQKRQPLDHAAGFKALSAVCVVAPTIATLSTAAQMACQGGTVSMVAGSEHRLELSFDGAAQGRRQDFRPALPLVFRW